MHPELIKAAMRIGGVTPAALADELRLSRMTVSAVIHGKGTSLRVAQRISQIVGKSLAELWPEKYGTTTTNRLRRVRKAA